MATITSNTFLDGGTARTAADVWTHSTRELTTSFPSVPTASANASAVRTELATELARIDATISSRESESSAATRASANISEHDATQTAISTLPTAPSVADIRSEMDTNSTKLDKASKALRLGQFLGLK